MLGRGLVIVMVRVRRRVVVRMVMVLAIEIHPINELDAASQTTARGRFVVALVRWAKPISGSEAGNNSAGESPNVQRAERELLGRWSLLEMGVSWEYGEDSCNIDRRLSD